jgi:hypothetical protein
MFYITYQEIKIIYGTRFANEILRLIERVANLQNDIMPLDRNERLQSAFQAMKSSETI